MTSDKDKAILRNVGIKIDDALADPVKFMHEHVRTDFANLPDGLRPGFARWWLFGIEGGSFLRAVLKGDLYDAFGQADDDNGRNLRQIVSWFYTHGDSRCIRRGYDAWLAGGGYCGLVLAQVRAEQAQEDAGE